MKESDKVKEYKFIKAKEYYAYDKFTGLTPYRMIGEMIYESFHSYKLQIRGEEKKDALEVYPDYNGLNEDLMSHNFPMCSMNLLLFMAPNKKNPDMFEALFMPEYDSAVSYTVSPNNSDSKMQFFYY